MRVMKALIVMTVLLAFSAVSHPMFAASDIHDEILHVYSFQPHLLSRAEIDQRSAELDKFWAKAQADPGRYVSGLRQELGDEKSPPFFLYDGSMLLLKMSDTSQDRRIALNAISHCDLRDVDNKDYFYQVHRMAVLDEDTTAAAFHILDDPKFQVVVPQHALTLGQNYSLIYMLLPTSPQFWTQAAIERVQREKDITAQRSLLLLLWYAQDDAADQAIHALGQDPSQSPETRKSVQELETGNQQILAATRRKLPFLSQDYVRRKRRKVMAGVSDEALIELDQLTRQLVAARRH